MKRIFGKINMNWYTVILFAIATGIYTGTVMIIPFLENTSFQDIGITYEWWVIFAVIIVVNCKKSWEAALKCFVFFLISQPTVYLVEMIFGGLPFDKAWLYYSTIWFPMTLLTLPGSFIAYFCKKQTILGGIILGLGNTIQAVMALVYLMKALHDFPHHLLSSLVSFASIFCMSFCIQKERKNRLVAIITPILLIVVLGIYLKMTGRVIY